VKRPIGGQIVDPRFYENLEYRRLDADADVADCPGLCICRHPIFGLQSCGHANTEFDAKNRVRCVIPCQCLTPHLPFRRTRSRAPASQSSAVTAGFVETLRCETPRSRSLPAQMHRACA
jgi:hypothetical protein